MPYSPDRRMVPKLGAIASLLRAAPNEGNTVSKPPNWLGHLPAGQLFFDSDLQLDTDGWAGYTRGDPSHQANTSLRYQDGSSVDANAVPYFVLPLPVEWSEAQGIGLGDYGVVLYGARIAYAVFADYGPAAGEGSLQLLRLLGAERLRRDGSVKNAGLDGRCLTLVFPGSGSGNRAISTQHALLADIAASASRAFEALGGKPTA